SRRRTAGLQRVPGRRVHQVRLLRGREVRKTLIALLVATATFMATTPASADDADRGREIARTECIACHGEDGNSLAPTFPKLAGLQHEYLAKQLQEYLDGKRTNEMMVPVIQKMKVDD